MEQRNRVLLSAFIVYAVIIVVSGGIPDCLFRRLRRSAWQCCGSNDVYNPRNQICCGGKVYDLSSGTLCCNRRIPFNPSTHICCNGAILHSRPGNTRCCGQSDYNPSTETCCGGQTVTPKGRCCGGLAFRPQTQACCGRPVPKPFQASSVHCCGHTAYDPAKHSCCRGSPRPIGYPCGFTCHGPCCDGKWKHPDICR